MRLISIIDSLMLSLRSRNLYSSTFFMILHFPICSEKIETHFHYLTYFTIVYLM